MAQLLLLVLCVKKAFCVKYTDFRCLCRPISLVYECRTFCCKNNKKTEGKHHEAWCSSPVSLYLKVRYVGLRYLLT